MDAAGHRPHTARVAAVGWRSHAGTMPRGPAERVDVGAMPPPIVRSLASRTAPAGCGEREAGSGEVDVVDTALDGAAALDGAGGAGSGGDPVAANRLEVDFVGEVHLLEPGDTLTFGRSADLVLDANPFMHRVVGRFTWRQGVWWLEHLGRSVGLELCDRDHGIAHRVPPGAQVSLTQREFSVRFVAGPTTYQLDGTLSAPPSPEAPQPVSGTATVAFGTVPFSLEQRELLVALVRSSRRHDGRLEPTPVIARRLGWTTKKFHRKLDLVCDKLARAGVRGLKGDVGSSADLRRERLVAHALGAGLVDGTDLIEPDPSATGPDQGAGRSIEIQSLPSR